MLPHLQNTTREFFIPKIGSDIILVQPLKVNISIWHSNSKALVALGFASFTSNSKWSIHYFDPITLQPIPKGDPNPIHYTFEFPIGTMFKFNAISIKRNPNENRVNVWVKLPGVAKKIRLDIGIIDIEGMLYQQIE